MSFTARLGADVTSVEAGSSIPLTIEIVNRAEEQDQVEMEVEGVDPEWTAVPVPTFTVEAGETRTERVFFKPPRTSESLAGNYPFVVKLRSLVSGEARTVQGVLEIKPYHHLSAEINPKRGSVSPMRRQEDYDLTLINLGNTEHTLQLVGVDPEDECSFAFEPEQATVGPGQQKEIYVGVTLNSQRPFSGSRLYGFTVNARSIEAPSVLSSAQAQLERKPLISPAALVASVVMLILAVGWWMLRPIPPGFEVCSLDRPEVAKGESINVQWQATHANSVKLICEGQELVKGPSGTYQFVPAADGEVTVVAIRDDKQSDPTTLPYKVRQPEPVPDPVIRKFSIDPSTLNKGQTAVARYDLNEAVVKATLLPQGLDLNLKGNTQEFVPTRTGVIEYTLVVENASGKTAKKTVKVTVSEGSLASIVKFGADPKEVPPVDGRTTLTWQLNNAVRAEISDGKSITVVDPNMGSQEFVVAKTTDFTLTGYDSDGHTVVKRVKVTVVEPPPVDNLGPPPSGGTVIR